MSEYANEVERLWHILDLIESSGGNVEDFDIDLRDSGGVVGAMAALASGSGVQEAVYTIEVTIPGEWEESDPPAEIDIDGLPTDEVVEE